MNKRAIIILAAVVLVGTSGATSAKSMMSSSGHSDTATNAMDQQFTTMAAMGGTAEIALSKVAVSHSANPKVKKFAMMMIHDHQMMGHGLAVTAMSAHLPVPMTLDAKHRAIRAKLMHLTGKNFDSAYLAAMIDDHSQTVSLFQKEIAYGKNIHLTNLATKNVGTVQNHLQMAHDLTGTQNKPSKIKNPKTSAM